MAMKQNNNGASVLHLSMRKEWYDMIEKGIKKEEYREFSDYWVKRLTKMVGTNRTFKYYSHICFHYGYTKRTMTYWCTCINLATPTHEEWGAPNYPVYIISIGALVAKTNSNGEPVALKK